MSRFHVNEVDRTLLWKTGIYVIRMIPTITTQTLWPNKRKTEMTISKQRRGITRFETQSCPLHDGEMCERKAGPMSLGWRRNATNRTVTAQALTRGVLRFLVLPLGILRHHHLCRSSTLIANIRRLNPLLVLQRPVRSPSQIPFTAIHPRPPLFMVLIHVGCRPLHCYAPFAPIHRGGD